MPPQSDTTKPVKPSSPLSTSVMRCASPWTLPSRVLENEVMTVRTPASMAGRYGARWMSRRTCVVDVGDALVDEVALGVELPHAVPPSPTKCLAVASAASSLGEATALEAVDEGSAELLDDGWSPR